MKFQHLSRDHVNRVLDACEAVENSRTITSLSTDDHTPAYTSESHDTACKQLSETFASIPDPAIIELQALAWAGRGDFNGNLGENLDYSKTHFDSTTSEYLASKTPLKEYIENGLRTSNVTLQD